MTFSLSILAASPSNDVHSLGKVDLLSFFNLYELINFIIAFIAFSVKR